MLPARVVEFSSRIELIGLESRYVSHQLITLLLLPRNREREPNLLALSAECRMYGQRAQNAASA